MNKNEIYNPFEEIERRLTFLESQLLIATSPTTLPEIFDTKNLISYLGDVSKPTLYRWIHTGYIPYYKVGKRVYFKRVDIETWLQSKRKATLSERIANAKIRRQTNE